jgi:ATP-dependent helicase/nuclease subunit B
VTKDTDLAPPKAPTADEAPERRQADPAWDVDTTWTWVADTVGQWCAVRGLPMRDVVLLLPYAALLPPARAAFARRAGWPPRIETPATLADALGPSPAGAAPGRDATSDRLAAAALLRQTPFGARWLATDPRGFRHSAQVLAETAGELAVAAASRPPPEREAFWRTARQGVGSGDGPGAVEQALLRLAVEWAAAEPPDDDRLLAHRPAAWVLVQVGGPDDVAEGVARSATAPVLRLVLDPPDTDPLRAAISRTEPPSLCVCEHAEAEAWATAQAVLDALAAGRTPVALVALDREGVRRVRALLERAGVALIDETGWKLSTTRAGARVMAALKAAAPQADDDAVLAWLKGVPSPPGEAQATRRFEARWRRARRRPEAGPWRAALDALRPLSESAADTRPLSAWSRRLSGVLQASGEWAMLQADPAGAAVLDALRLSGDDAAGSPEWAGLAGAALMDLSGFTAWVDTELERGSVTLPSPGARVVLTPLARVPMRPFRAVVVGGVDARHLGVDGSAPGLIGEALAGRLGLDSAERRRQRQTLAFAQLLRLPALTLLRRRQEGDEPLGPSPTWQWLQLRRLQAGLGPWIEQDATPATVEVPRQPVPRPLPVAPQALPASLTASQVEQLRRCPYQFFARTLLRLSEADELAREAEKRDYGNWLHAVLHRFHRDGADGLAALQAAAEAELAATGFEASALLPYRASFAAFGPAYIAWWDARQAAGWRWLEGETEHRAEPPVLAPIALRGRLDRVDQRGATRCVVDYKTGSRQGLLDRIKAPDEDVQLAFYAALLGPETGHEPEAAYLTLDDPRAPELLAHRDAGAAAGRLITGLADELARVRAGAPLPALGDGEACTFCEVRGLCRRDHWEAP